MGIYFVSNHYFTIERSPDKIGEFHLKFFSVGAGMLTQAPPFFVISLPGTSQAQKRRAPFSEKLFRRNFRIVRKNGFESRPRHPPFNRDLVEPVRERGKLWETLCPF